MMHAVFWESTNRSVDFVRIFSTTLPRIGKLSVNHKISTDVVWNACIVMDALFHRKKNDVISRDFTVMHTKLRLLEDRDNFVYIIFTYIRNDMMLNCS